MPKILVVDDDQPFRTLVRHHLESIYEIVETGDATAALALTLETKPDAILMDLNMPQFSGFELCTVLSDLSATQLIPIIMVTGESAARIEQVAKVLSIAGFVQKPFDFEDLKNRISTVLEKRQPQRRSEPRVRLAVALRIAGRDATGVPFDASIRTYDVSVKGFSFYSSSSLSVGTALDVWMLHGKNAKQGRALIVRAERTDTPDQRYGVCLLDRPEPWILQ
jgi:DNA-binding response OmpR family regulator